MHKNKENIELINKFFPYNHFIHRKEYKLICHFLPLIVKLNKEKNNFNIKISDKSFDFKYKDNSDFIPTFSFFDYNNILFGFDTFLQFGDITNLSPEAKKKYVFEFPKKPTMLLKDFYKYSLLFVYLTRKCIDAKIKKTKDLKGHADYFLKNFETIDSELNERCTYLNDFYINDNSPMIAKLWNLIYFINDKCIINNLITILNKVESNMLDVVSKLFDEINYNEIELYIGFTKKMANFCKRNSILWKAMFGLDLFEKKETKEEALEIKEKILQEKQNIEAISNFKNIWKNDEYINYLNKSLEIIKIKILKMNKEKEKQMIEQKIADLIKKLTTTPINDESMKKMRDIMKSNFETGEPTKEFLAQCESKVNEFLKSLTSSKEESKTNIWPSYYQTIDYNYKNKDTYSPFFDCLLWYSKSSFLLKSYFDKNKSENSISIGNKLIAHGLETICNFLNFKEANKQIITATETEQLFSIIKMQFLNRLIENNCYEKIIYMRKIFNDIKERNFIKNKDYKWICDIANNYQLDFNIVFPDFNNPKDLLFLFISITNEPNIFKEGPMKIGEKDKELIAELKDKVNSEIKTYEECAIIITKAIYNVYISITENFGNENKNIKLFIENKMKEFKENSEKKLAVEILKKCNFILEIGEDLSRKDETKLEFDDMEFLNCKIWEFGDNFTKKYPSLVYWLIKNERSYLEIKNNQNLIEWYNKAKNSEKIEYIPFFVLCLRLMSSCNCIIFELINPNTSGYQKTKQLYITSEIIKDIEKRSEENMTIKWFNIMLKSVPSYIFDENYRYFYNYLNFLTQDNRKMDEFPEKIKDETVNSIIKNIIELVMNEKIDDEIKKIFTKGNKNSEVLYLFDPAQMIFDKIKSIKDEKLTNFINNEKFLKIEKQIKALVNKEIPKRIEKLEKGITDDITEFEEVAESEYQKEKESSLKKLYDNIDKINQFLENIITDVEINENMTFPLYSAKVEEYLKEINSILDDQVNHKVYESLFDTKEPIDIYTFRPSIGDTYEIKNIKEDQTVYKENGVKTRINIIFPKKIFNVKYEKEIKELHPTIDEYKGFNRTYIN